MEWDKYGFVRVSRIRKDILLSLRKKPSLPSEIAHKLGIDKSQVTRALRELEENDLVICLTPQNRKGRLYTISREGKLIIRKL